MRNKFIFPLGLWWAKRNLIFLSGAAILGVAVTYLVHRTSSNKNLKIPESLQKLKNNKEILDEFFPNLSVESEGEDWANDKPPNNFLGNASDKATGRLVVNWEKYKPTSGQSPDKWSGAIRWLWTFVNEGKGLLVFMSAKATSEDSKLDVEGVIYTLSSDETKGQDDSKEWKIKHNKKIADNLKIDDADNKFPVVGDIFKNSLKVKEYWGFLDSSKKLTDVCKLETITEDKSTEKFRGSWVWTKEGEGASHKPLAWSKDDHKWINTLYSTPQPKLEDLMTNFSGTWNEENFLKKELGVTVTP